MCDGRPKPYSKLRKNNKNGYKKLIRSTFYNDEKQIKTKTITRERLLTMILSKQQLNLQKEEKK